MPKKENDKVEQPDFRSAAGIMRQSIAASNDAKSKALGDLSAAWKRIEDDFHVNKKAAKQIMTMLNMSDATRDDYLRSLYGLMQEFNISISADLVDQAGDGNAPTMPVKQADASESALVN